MLKKVKVFRNDVYIDEDGEVSYFETMDIVKINYNDDGNVSIIESPIWLNDFLYSYESSSVAKQDCLGECCCK